MLQIADKVRAEPFLKPVFVFQPFLAQASLAFRAGSPADMRTFVPAYVYIRRVREKLADLVKHVLAGFNPAFLEDG